MSRSAAGRRRQMRAAQLPSPPPSDTSRAPSFTTQQSRSLSSPDTLPDFYSVSSVSPTSSNFYSPSIPPNVLAPAPLNLSPSGHKYWNHQPVTHEFRYPSPASSNSGSPFVPMRISSPVLQPIYPASPPPTSFLLQRTQSKPSAEPSAEPPPGFVYPSPSRSGARPSNTTPTSPTFPKIRLKSKKRKDKSRETTTSGAGQPNAISTDNTSQPPGGRFRALLSRSKKKKKIAPGPIMVPTTPVPPQANTPRTASSSISENGSVGTVSSGGFQEVNAWIKKQDQTLHPYPSEAPYMQAYDQYFLENDRQTTTLLRRLSPRGSPTFHDYGQNPPSAILDLGCGQGHWVLGATAYWKPYGTRVTGFDLVDLTRAEWDQARGQNQNAGFIRGNFLKHKLPFPDKSFDLVRMANLTLCIPYNKWERVLSEVRRVMTIGGRLELIDDQIIFPYAKPSSLRSASLASLAPRINIPIPSPSIGIAKAKHETDGHYDLDDILGQVKDDDGVSSDSSYSNKTIDGESDAYSKSQPQEKYNKSRPSTPRRPLPPLPPSPWEIKASSSQGLEAVFENMLNEKYYIHPRPAEFLLDMLKRVFGKRHSSLMKSMHIELAPTDYLDEAQDAIHDASRANYGAMAAAAAAAASSRRRLPQDALSQCPGIILWPSTFIPIPAAELEMHACKHIRTLLGCKAALADYIEIRENDDVRVVDEEFWDAMYDYESFIRQRFDGIARAPEVRVDPSQAHARHDSLLSSDSSSYQESVLEYQSLLRHRFDLDSVRSESSVELDSPILSSSLSSGFKRHDGRRDIMPVSDRASSLASSPPYTPQELTHIRTIRVYEALKLSEEALV